MKILKITSLIIISNFILGNNIASNINDDIINLENQNEYINVWVYFLDKGPINIEQEINKVTKNRVSCILAVHAYGLPIDIDKLRKITSLDRISLLSRLTSLLK